MKIHTRAALAALVLIAVLGAIGAGITVWQLRAIDARADVRALDTAHALQRLIEDARSRELEQTSGVLARDPGFVGYVAQAMNSGDIPGEQVDVASIRDLLDERRREFGFDIAAVLDPAGRTVVVAGSALEGAFAIASTPLVTTVCAGSVADIALWSHNGRLLLVSVAPMQRGSTLEALLLTGIDLDTRFMEPIARSGHVDVALLGIDGGQHAVTGSTFDPSARQRLLAAIDAQPALFQDEGLAQAAGGFTVDLGDGPTQAALTPLFGTPDAGLLVSIVPFEQRMTISGAVRAPMLAGGALAVLIVLVFAWILRYRVFKPIADLDDLSARMLRGDFQLVAKTAGTPAVARIGAAFNHVLTELRGYKEAIEQRRGRG